MVDGEAFVVAIGLMVEDEDVFACLEIQDHRGGGFPCHPSSLWPTQSEKIGDFG